MRWPLIDHIHGQRDHGTDIGHAGWQDQGITGFRELSEFHDVLFGDTQMPDGVPARGNALAFQL
jgi:hypothetical protein